MQASERCQKALESLKADLGFKADGAWWEALCRHQKRALSHTHAKGPLTVLTCCHETTYPVLIPAHSSQGQTCSTWESRWAGVPGSGPQRGQVFGSNLWKFRVEVWWFGPLLMSVGQQWPREVMRPPQTRLLHPRGVIFFRRKSIFRRIQPQNSTFWNNRGEWATLGTGNEEAIDSQTKERPHKLGILLCLCYYLLSLEERTLIPGTLNMKKIHFQIFKSCLN